MSSNLERRRPIQGLLPVKAKDMNMEWYRETTVVIKKKLSCDIIIDEKGKHEVWSGVSIDMSLELVL